MTKNLKNPKKKTQDKSKINIKNQENQPKTKSRTATEIQKNVRVTINNTDKLQSCISHHSHVIDPDYKSLKHKGAPLAL